MRSTSNLISLALQEGDTRKSESDHIDSKRRLRRAEWQTNPCFKDGQSNSNATSEEANGETHSWSTKTQTEAQRERERVREAR